MMPPILRRDYNFQAVADVMGSELDLLDVSLDTLERNMFPTLADTFLSLQEAVAGLSANTTDPIETRRNALLAWLRRMVATGSGLDWEAAITDLVGTTWSYTIPSHHTITVSLPYVSSSALAKRAEEYIRSISQAADIINFAYGEGFTLDQSQMDSDLL